jgi:hypothetical protein
MNIFGRITSVAGRKSGIFEDPVITTATPEELAEAKDRNRLSKSCAAAPELIRLMSSFATRLPVRLESNISALRSQVRSAKLSTSTMILAAKLESLSDQPPSDNLSLAPPKSYQTSPGIYHRANQLVSTSKSTTQESIKPPCRPVSRR